MAKSLDATFGETPCRIYTQWHVEIGANKFPAVAKAFANDTEVMEAGALAERVGSTEDQAIEAMCSYLEKLYGPRAK